MKQFLFSLLCSFFGLALYAQSASTESVLEINGQKYPCYVQEYDLSPDLAEATIKDAIKSKGYKPKESKGILFYRDVVLPAIDPEKPHDIFIKVERKSRSEKDKSLVYTVVTKPGEIPDDKVKGAGKTVVSGVGIAGAGMNLMSGFQADIDLKAYEVAVENQEDLVKKEEKKLRDLRDDQSKLEKKIKELQDDLEVNKKDQEKQAAEVEKQKQVLEETKAKKPRGV